MTLCSNVAFSATPPPEEATDFRSSLESYGDQDTPDILSVLANRIRRQPFNLVATLIFLGAIVHTFLSSKFMTMARRWEHEHEKKIEQGLVDGYSVRYRAELFHFLGEVEVIFALWALALLAAIIGFFDWQTAVHYIGHRVNFAEALFLVTIMTLAATRPILKLSETVMQKIAGVLGGGLTAWWFTILTMGPVLGSFITEPAAMTISALLLSRKFYHLNPSNSFKYATLGLLFVNISVGGMLTHFAAPPVLMVASPWRWDTLYMITQFGWKAVFGILVVNGLYFLLFRKELARLRHDFLVEELKHRIQTELIKRRELEAEIERIGPETAEALDTEKTFRGKMDEIIQHVKQRLQEEYLPCFLGNDVDPDLIKEAFDKRFDEITLQKVRR